MSQIPLPKELPIDGAETDEGVKFYLTRTVKQYGITVNATAKLYNQGTMTFYAHENVENLGVYIFSCSFTRALICGKIIINDVVSVQPQKEIEMKTTDINKVRYTNRWRIVYGICNN